MGINAVGSPAGNRDRGGMLKLKVAPMRHIQQSGLAAEGPRRPWSHCDDVNEAPDVVRNQPTDVEEEVPIEGNVSIEAGDSPGDAAPEPPVFEE